MFKSKDRKYIFGSEIIKDKGVSFNIWASQKNSVRIKITGGIGFNPEDDKKNFLPLIKNEDGFYTGIFAGAGAGTLYKVIIDNKEIWFPDPASRYQPDGPHGPSMVVDQTFEWTDSAWKGPGKNGQIIYEMHVGTFTQEGTWNAAAEQLEELASLGITIIEIMPVAEFPGKYGWGYDGVDLFAPYHFYGTPAELKNFINKAHLLNVAVILDVVYNHFGPDGNYLKEFSPAFFSTKYKTDWGEALNFDEKDSEYVRTFYLENVTYWIEDFHFDGLRLDASQSIYDDSEPHILKEISELVRHLGGKKGTYLIAENEPQDNRFLKPYDKGGYEFDGIWNDDFHHTAMVALTGKSEAYYTDYNGSPQEFISSVKYGFLYQGQWYKWQSHRRGMPALHSDASLFISFIQNHDQTANSGTALRISKLTSEAKIKALTALMILGPGTPMIFMGQEFGSTSPFYYIEDHHPELSKLVYKGRFDYLQQFRSLATTEMTSYLPDPSDVKTFLASKLNFQERTLNNKIYQLHKDLINLKKTDPAIKLQDKSKIDGAVLGQDAFVIRYFGDDDDDRLLVINLGKDLFLNPAPEPLLSPPENAQWVTLWSSEDPAYGGSGTFPLDTENNWIIPGNAAVVLKPDLIIQELA